MRRARRPSSEGLAETLASSRRPAAELQAAGAGAWRAPDSMAGGGRSRSRGRSRRRGGGPPNAAVVVVGRGLRVAELVEDLTPWRNLTASPCRGRGALAATPANKRRTAAALRCRAWLHRWRAGLGTLGTHAGTHSRAMCPDVNSRSVGSYGPWDTWDRFSYREGLQSSVMLSNVSETAHDRLDAEGGVGPICPICPGALRKAPPCRRLACKRADCSMCPKIRAQSEQAADEQKLGAGQSAIPPLSVRCRVLRAAFLVV
jgi:hypothetical protein